MCMNVEQVKLDRKKLDKFEWKPIIKYEESETVYSLDIHGIHFFHMRTLVPEADISEKDK